MSEHPHVGLGVKENGEAAHDLPVYPQTWPRIVNRLGRLYDHVRKSGGELRTDDLDAQSLVAFLGEHTYEALCVFIPNLPQRMPEYRFAGFGSQDAFEARDYDERQDQAPTFPQMFTAFEICFEVNGGKRFLDMLGKAFDPKLLRAEMSLALSEWREGRSGSLSSPGANGPSLPTSSGTTDPTSESPDTPAQSEKSASSSGIPLSV